MWLQPPAHAGSSLADFSILKMESIHSYETSVHTRSTRRHIPEDDILQLLLYSLISWAVPCSPVSNAHTRQIINFKDRKKIK
jgi:hypothetical protein